MVYLRYNKEMDDVKPWDLLNPNKPRSSEELSNERLEICRGCEWYKAKSNQCKKCGCFMKLKTTLAEARCPIGKW
jgi:hypothetical protein